MSGGAQSLSLIPLCSIPHVKAGDDLTRLIAEAAKRDGVAIGLGDIFVVAQKIVSKSIGLIVDLRTVEPSPEAIEIAARTGKDAPYVEVVLRESNAVIASREHVLITEHLSGCVLANGGVDRSNIDHGGDDCRVLLLPRDPDALAEQLRDGLCTAFDTDIGVIICDSWGRPWRMGTVGCALGVAGLSALHDYRGRKDLYGRTLEVAVEAVADELAGAANIVMGQGDEAIPVVVVRGFKRTGGQGSAKDLQRPKAEDLFR